MRSDIKHSGQSPGVSIKCQTGSEILLLHVEKCVKNKLFFGGGIRRRSWFRNAFLTFSGKSFRRVWVIKRFLHMDGNASCQLKWKRKRALEIFAFCKTERDRAEDLQPLFSMFLSPVSLRFSLGFMLLPLALSAGFSPVQCKYSALQKAQARWWIWNCPGDVALHRLWARPPVYLVRICGTIRGNYNSKISPWINLLYRDLCWIYYRVVARERLEDAIYHENHERIISSAWAIDSNTFVLTGRPQETVLITLIPPFLFFLNSFSASYRLD